MKKFIKLLLLFILIPAATSVLLFSVSLFLFNKKVNSLRLNKETSILICGDSHTESGINDSLLKNSINISFSSEHYLFTYNVLKLVIKNNPRVKTIIMGCSFHTFSAYDKQLFDYESSELTYPRYLPILDKESVATIVKNNMSGTFKSTIQSLRNMIVPLVKNDTSYPDYSFIGKYYQSNNSFLNDSAINATIKRHYYKDSTTVCDFSNLQLYYLNKIIDLCQTHQIRLALVSTPMSSMYYKKIPKKAISGFYSAIASFKNKVEFWDFYSLNVESNCYGDGDHLNAVGAAIFTPKIDSLINSNASVREPPTKAEDNFFVKKKTLPVNPLFRMN